jgi:hypothetical protein
MSETKIGEGPESQEDTKKIRLPRKELTTGLFVAVGLTAMILMFLTWALVGGMSAVKKDDLASVKTDVAALQKDKDVKGDVANLLLRAKLTEDHVIKLNKKVDDVATATRSLIGSANALKDEVAALGSDMATKADKTALSKLATKRRLSYVENKFEAYLLVESAKETIPLANSETKPPATDDGTITVIVRPVPVDDEQ